jgi:phosphoribosylaminoimidazole-succinocarboxamide synthase
MVIRAYLTGHAWREYKSGKRMLCVVPLPEGMTEFQAFPEPIITPATKADEGHDEDISREEIIAQGIVPKEAYEKLEACTRALFKRGTEMAADRGLILADTKYEFGHINGEIILMDEIHTPDSSRYFYKEGFEENVKSGKAPKHLSKEFVRQWLIDNGFQGLEGQQMPFMPDGFVDQVSNRYIELYELLTGKKFEFPPEGDPIKRIEGNLLAALS